MAKRLTDTEKWNKSWFLDLEGKHKLLWFYLLENCNHCGIIDIHPPTISAKIKLDYSFEEIVEVFKNKIFHIKDTTYFIPKFVVFQYGTQLNPDNKCHLSVIRGLEQYNISNYIEIISNLKQIEAPTKGLARVNEGVKDKDKNILYSLNNNTNDHTAPRKEYVSPYQLFYETWNKYCKWILETQEYKLSSRATPTKAKDKNIKRNIECGLTIEKYRAALTVASEYVNKKTGKKFYLSGDWFDFDWMFRAKNQRGDYVCNWLSLIEKGESK